jgi:hypothetical protein
MGKKYVKVRRVLFQHLYGAWQLKGRPEAVIPKSMNISLSTIAWPTETLWREANASLSQSVSHHRHRLSEALRLASSLRGHLMSIFPIMDSLCQLTCPDCADICCRHAWVWADFKDLLFLHLAGIPVPDRQLVGRRGDHCRYASPQGCRLERLQRPFVCTWYICPAQTRTLSKQPAEKERLTTVLKQIKDDRQLLEGRFIQAIFMTGAHGS